ncbi:hypothetical protein KM043_004395 [Ampulex compressa]|nr:hypothetical protein KM043_004395 [Ampulex compressa]
MGKDRYKYFQRPIIPLVTPNMHNVEIPTRIDHDVISNVVKNAQKQCYIPPCKTPLYNTIATQTDYRESETQTSPWEPPYRIRPGHNPEILAIAHLVWNHGLPAGIHEVEIINRMRMRKAWEDILPPMDTPANIKMRTSIISALEIDEWAYRESEIQAVMDYRLKLMHEITETRECEQYKKISGRFSRLRDNLCKRREKQVEGIRHTLRRELRKLQKKHKDKRQYKKRDIVEEYADPASEVYAPQMRFGEHPKRRHEMLQKALLKETLVDSAENVDTLPSLLPMYKDLKTMKAKANPTDLCIRETRWTEEKLKQLHFDLKAIRLKLIPTQTTSLMKRKYKLPVLPSTPHRLNTEHPMKAKMDHFSVLLQKLVRGRAIQCIMFEGRNRYRELIEELQSTHALEAQGKKARQKEKMQMTKLQQLQNDRSMQEDRLCEILNSLEGSTISGMLDFLSKKLIRLQEERKIHAFALLAEQERCMREAAEAGRRQMEFNRRREFDEMFRQIVKINQDSVECYLEDIIKEGVECVSDEAAKKYILELSEKVDIASKYAEDNATELEQEEMIADMIYNFVLPEVDKQAVRKKIREKQQDYLRNAHAVIYEKIFDLPPVEQLSIGETENEGEGDVDDLTEELMAINLDAEEFECPGSIQSLEYFGTRIENTTCSTEHMFEENKMIVQDLLNFIISEIVKVEDIHTGPQDVDIL